MDLHKSIAEELECTICYRRYHDPRVLDCHHSFCRKCLEKTMKSPNPFPPSHVQCPLCRQKTEFPPLGVAGLQQDFRLNRLLRIVDVHEAKGKPGLDFCGTCPRDKPKGVTSYCPDCRIAMCKECARIHSLIPATKGHSLVEISGLFTEEMDISWPGGDDEANDFDEGFMKSSRMINDSVNDYVALGCSCIVL